MSDLRVEYIFPGGKNSSIYGLLTAWWTRGKVSISETALSHRGRAFAQFSNGKREIGFSTRPKNAILRYGRSSTRSAQPIPLIRIASTVTRTSLHRARDLSSTFAILLIINSSRLDAFNWCCVQFIHCVRTSAIVRSKNSIYIHIYSTAVNFR